MILRYITSYLHIYPSILKYTTTLELPIHILSENKNKVTNQSKLEASEAFHNLKALNNKC